MDQKTLAGHIDAAAHRAIKLKLEPATKKQCWLLAELLLRRRRDGEIENFATNHGRVLTTQDASQMIDLFRQ